MPQRLPPNLNRRPTSFASMGAPPPQNSEIRKAAEDALGALKYSLSAVLANPQARVREGSLEESLKREVLKMPVKELARYQTIAKELVELPEAGRTKIFGRYGVLAPEEFASAGFDRVAEMLETPLMLNPKLLGAKVPTIALQPGVSVMPAGAELRLTGLPLRADFEGTDFESAQLEIEERARTNGIVNEERISDVWGPTSTDDVLVDPDEFEGQDFLDKLTLKIERIKCADETNPEWPGGDEIALAGISVDETGDTKQIAEKYIGGGFDDGDQKSYSPHWKYHWFSVREEMVANQWPKKYLLTMILAEKDNGGLSSALNAIWDKVKKTVKEKIEAAIGGVLSAYLGPVIANAIGAAVAWVVDVFVGWIIKLWNDDIFPPANCWMTHGGPHARFTRNGQWGSPRSNSLRSHFYGHGGHYYVDYHWLLHK